MEKSVSVVLVKKTQDYQLISYVFIYLLKSKQEMTLIVYKINNMYMYLRQKFYVEKMFGREMKLWEITS